MDSAALPIAVIGLGAVCLLLSVYLIISRRRARARLQEANQRAHFYKTHIEALARTAIVASWEVPYQERLKTAAHALVFPEDGPLDERRACLEYHAQSKSQPIQLLKQLTDRPIDRKRARLASFQLAHILQPYYLTAGWRVDCITSVPSSQAHTTMRGFNPSEMLARETAAIVGLPYRPLIVRTRETISQREANTRAGRAANVEGAFAAAKGVQGQRILIVEDVVISGATLQACAAALKAAGAERVYALSLASSGRPRFVEQA